MNFSALTQSISWNWFFVYTLFIASTFSIAASEASITFLYLIGLVVHLWRRYLPRMNDSLLWVMLGYIAVVEVSSLLSPYQPDLLMALRNNWRFLLPFILASVFQERHEETVLQWFFLFLFLFSLYGVIQFFTGVDWLRLPENSLATPYGDSGYWHGKGNFTHHLTFGGYLVVCFPLTVALVFCKEWGPAARFLMVLLALTVFAGIISSMGRSVWLGTLVASVVLGLWIMPRTTLLAVLGVGLLAWGLYSQYSHASPMAQQSDSPVEALQQRLASAFSPDANRDRLYMWASGWDAIQDHYWLGIGYDTDEEVIREYRKPYEAAGHTFLNGPGVGLHNLYLQTWLSYGLVGLLSFLGIWVLFFAKAFRAILRSERFTFSNAVLWGTVAGIVGHLTAANFENNFHDGEVQTIVLIMMGLGLAQMERLNRRIFNPKSTRRPL